MSRANRPWIRAARGAGYALAIVGNLWAISALLGVEFTAPYQVLAVVTGTAAFVVLRDCELLTPWMPGRRGSIGTRVAWRWVGLVGALLLTGYLTRYADPFSREVTLIWVVSTPLVLLALHRLCVAGSDRLFAQAAGPRTCVLVHVDESARSLVRDLRQSHRYELVGFFEDRDVDRPGESLEGVPYLGKARSVAQYVRDHGIDAVFVVLPDGGRRPLSLLDDLVDTKASVYYVPDFLIVNLIQAQVREIEGATVLEMDGTPFYGVDGRLKRGFDLLFSFSMLVLLSPLMITVALIIKLTSAGPVIFKQKRYGLNGQRFWAYKFRSMVSDPGNPRSGETPASQNDPRITPIGHFIRRTSIDELPQFFNVLRGEMSVVGPRPHAVAHNEFYRRAVKRYMAGHRIKPGLTGWAQVNGVRGEMAHVERMDECIGFDLEYVGNWSPMFDLRIVLMTIGVILRGRNVH